MWESLRAWLNGDENARSAMVENLIRLGFRDGGAAHRLRGLTDQSLSTEMVFGILRKLLGLLSEVPDPDAGLIDFERFVQGAGDRVELFQFLDGNPRAIEMLVRLFATSRYLTETVLRNPDSLRELTRHRRLAELKSREEFLNDALSQVASAPDFPARMDALRRFQRWELLRIGACDAFGLIDLRAATVQLSLLADSLVQACLTLVGHELMLHSTNLTVLALGKLGGEELNYSSDIDLVFLTDRSPTEALPLAQRLVKSLQDTTGEGFLYRVDVRLRPWGRSGELVTTIPSYLEYLKSHAEMWEKQALLKARVIAGPRDLGRELLRRAEPYIFGAAPGDVVAAVRQAKGRIEADLRRRGREWGEVKLGSGSIRDIEFLVQALQLVHGAEHRHVRSPNTLNGLVRLTDAGVLHADEYRRLTDGYVFLRTIEHSLQLMNNRQEHSLPTDGIELTALARRLDFGTSELLLAHFDSHCKSIRSIFDKYLAHDRVLVEPLHSPPIPDREREREQSRLERDRVPQPPLETYASVFNADEQQRHSALLAELNAERPVRVVGERDARDCDQPRGESSSPPPNRWRVTVVGHDCPGELSMICGLLFANGLNIIEGFVSTETRPRADSVRERLPHRFVDVFEVQSSVSEMSPEVWSHYERDLTELVCLAQGGRVDEAQGRLAKRVADALEVAADAATKPAPLEVRFDNEAHATATVLHIRGDDTPGFLYELSNALTLSGVSIVQVMIRAESHRAHDTLLVTDAHSGEKILDAARLQELQAAVVLIKHFTHLLPAAPNPQAALLHFRSFLRDLFQRPDWVDQLSSLERPEVMSALAQLLGVSDFLWEDFLRLQYANLFPVLHDIAGLQQSRSQRQLADALDRELNGATTADERRTRLNEFKDRELFRIDMRHILGHSGGVDEFGREMTDLAEVVVAAAVEFCHAELVERFGSPATADGRECRLSVNALGKCGGRELGFASDIELLFVYDSDGMTQPHPTPTRSVSEDVSPVSRLVGAPPLRMDYETAPRTYSPREQIDNASFYSRLVESVSHAIHARNEGIFRIDLRMRPYGRAGSLAVSLAAFRNYFQHDGPAWPYERQALVKLRPIAGDEELGTRLKTLRDELIYTSRRVDFGAIRAMRERQLRSLVGATEFHAKLSPGGLVDLEYLVQTLQLDRGAKHPELRATNTHEALDALRQVGALTAADHERLCAAYHFLRRLIDALRMVRGEARDLTVPPAGSADLESLARRLGFGPQTQRLHDDLTHHTQAVTDLVRAYSTDPHSDS